MMFFHLVQIQVAGTLKGMYDRHRRTEKQGGRAYVSVGDEGSGDD